MYRRFPPVGVVLPLTAILAFLMASGCDFSEEGKPKETPVAGTNTQSIGAAGSTFIAPLMARWASND